jgi:hypothetical protein
MKPFGALAILLVVASCRREPPAPPRTLVGPLAPWVDPQLRAGGATCRTDSLVGYTPGPAPHRTCDAEERGRLRARVVVAADSTVVSTLALAVILPEQRPAAIAAESAAVAARLGPGRRCAYAIAWQRDGWYLVSRWQATAREERDYERKPWTLLRLGGIGRVPYSWCPEASDRRG